MKKTGVIHGRFQVLHNDHLKYLLAGKKRCEHLVVGITNPDPFTTRKDQADLGRSDPLANPLTYYERYRMVRTALTGAGLVLDEFSTVPFPINLPNLYRYYVPMDAVFYLTIYDKWGEKKLAMFTELGLQTEILWRCSPEKKGLSAKDIRRLIADGGPWQAMVPPGIAELIKEFGLPARLRQNPTL